MEFSLILSYLPYALITNFTPGPNNILALNSTKIYGFSKSKNILLGICTGFSIIMLLCGLICVYIGEMNSEYLYIMRYIGAIYICWLAWHILISEPNSEIKDNEKSSFFYGFITQFINIKVILYGTVSISTFVLPYTQSSVVIFIFVAGMSILGAVAALTWALAGSLFQSFLNKYYKIFNFVMALILLKSAFDLIY